MRKNFVYGLLLIFILITMGVSGCVSTDGTCEDMCGDGICQEVVCQAIGCPCAETRQTCPQDCKSAELPNPAAVYCERDKGGVFQAVETPEGTVGYCSLPDGSVCEEWAFFNSNGTDCVPPE
jgi:putative hemolysin